MANELVKPHPIYTDTSFSRWFISPTNKNIVNQWSNKVSSLPNTSMCFFLTSRHSSQQLGRIYKVKILPFHGCLAPRIDCYLEVSQTLQVVIEKGPRRNVPLKKVTY